MMALDPIKAMYGSEAKHRKARGASDLMVRLKELEREIDAMRARRQSEARAAEFGYPPWVQEALEFIERETAAYELREQEAGRKGETGSSAPDSRAEL
jgi:hypothetical protein